jgi:hypothetical protein
MLSSGACCKSRLVDKENGMGNTSKTFEKRKQEVLRAAKEQGIVDVVSAADGGVSLDTIELATRLMEKHGPGIYKDLEERRKRQKR